MSFAVSESRIKKYGFLPTHEPHLIKSFFFKIFITNGNDINVSRSCYLGQGDLLKLIALFL